MPLLYITAHRVELPTTICCLVAKHSESAAIMRCAFGAHLAACAPFYVQLVIGAVHLSYAGESVIKGFGALFRTVLQT